MPAHLDTAEHRAAGWSAALIIGILAAVGLALRAPDALLFPQFLAEDGTAFFADQLGHRLPQLFGVVQGYWVILDRVVAWASSFVPTIAVPLAYNVLAIALSGACITYFSLRARALFEPVTSFSALLLVPIINIYVLDNVTHLQWWTQFALAAASLLPRAQRSGNRPWVRVVEAICLTVVALNGPFAVLCVFVYLLLAGAWAVARIAKLRRTDAGIAGYLRSLDPVAVCITVAAAVIVWTIAIGAGKVHAPFSPDHVRQFVAVVLGLGLQVHGFGPVLVSPEKFVGFQLLLVAAAVAVPRSASARLGCLSLLAYGLLCLLAGFAKSTSLGLTAPQFNYGDTYFIALAVIEWLVVSHLLGVLLFGRRFAAAVATIAALAFLTIRHPYWHVRKDVPDLNWPFYAGQIEAGKGVDVPILPPGWHVRIAPRPPAATGQPP